jgi:hypothetical protein
LTKRAHFFTEDKEMFIVHIHKKKVEKNCFELAALGSISKCLPSGWLLCRSTALPRHNGFILIAF